MARFRQPYLYGIDRERDVRAILREMVRGKWGCSLPDAPSGQGLYHAPGDAPIDEVDGRPPLSLSLRGQILTINIFNLTLLVCHALCALNIPVPGIT